MLAIQNAVQDAGSLRKLAFTNQYNVIFMVGSLAFSAALMSPWPVVIGAVIEFFWMTIGATSESFQRWAHERLREDQRSQRAAEDATAVRGLEPAYATRTRGLQNMAGEIRRLARERGIDPRLFDGPDDRLEMLLASFVKMAALHQRLSRFVSDSGPNHLEEEIVRLGQSLADEKDPAVRLSLRQALTLGQRRLKQHEQIDSQRRALGVKMGTLEMSFDYLRSHVFSGSPPQELAIELQELIAGASFLNAAEAEANASLARMGAGTSITRTVTGQAIGE
jgi:hypothetical protein